MVQPITGCSKGPIPFERLSEIADMFRLSASFATVHVGALTQAEQDMAKGAEQAYLRCEDVLRRAVVGSTKLEADEGHDLTECDFVERRIARALFEHLLQAGFVVSSVMNAARRDVSSIREAMELVFDRDLSLSRTLVFFREKGKPVPSNPPQVAFDRGDGIGFLADWSEFEPKFLAAVDRFEPNEALR